MKDINKKMADGAAWMLLFKILDKSIGTISTFVLVRLLAPEDFGLIAMSMAFLGMLSLLVSFSFDVALIQNQRTTRAHYDTVWTFHVIFGVLLGVILAVSAIPAAHFYNEPRLEYLLYVLALSCPIEWSSNIGTVAFRKELQFHKEFIFNLIKRLLVFFSTLALAYYLKNYWALAFGVLFGKILSNLISYIAHPFRPRFSLAARDELFSFSKWTFLNSVVGFIKVRASDFVIAKMAGTEALGIFTIANEISGLVSSEVIAPINRVALPGYSKLNNNLEEFRITFLKIQSVIVVCAAPAALGVIATANIFVPCLLGDKWLATIPIIQFMALQGVLDSLSSNSNVVCLALGKPKMVTITLMIYSITLLIGLYYFITPYGILGAAYAGVIASLVSAPVIIGLSLFFLKINILKFIIWIWRPIISSLCMYFIVKSTILELNNYFVLNKWAELGISILVGILSYIVLLLILWSIFRKPDGGEKIIFGFVGSKIKGMLNVAL